MARQASTNKVSKFTVTTSEPELVGPAKPTPRELKQLSDIDNTKSLRFLVPIIQFCRYNPSMEGKDPAMIIRRALADTLVFYYPLAGRVVEGPDGRVSVDCTGEGVLFVEADADVELRQLGDPPRPPFPWLDQVLYTPVSGGILNSPLLFIQVTRLKCGGFIVAFRYNHTMCDAAGLTQFAIALGQIARGAHVPSVTPIWHRELFSAPTYAIRRAERPTHFIPVSNKSDVIEHSFFFGPSQLSAIRRLVPDHLRSCSTTFEILTACLWRCRVTAFQSDPEDAIRLTFPINAREKANQVVPVGYYGNAFSVAVIETSARELCDGPIENTIGLVKKAKEVGAEEYKSWLTNLDAIMDQGSHFADKCFNVSDVRQVGFGEVDLGWGKAVYAGMAKIESEQVAVYLPFRNHEQVDGLLVSMCLQTEVMGRFETELNNLLGHAST